MSVDNQPAGIYAKLQVNTVEGGQVIGVQVGTLINSYTIGAAGVLPQPAHQNQERYKFLSSYTFEERDIFFGRAPLANRLAGNIMRQPTTALVGKPAVGKTSLIHAGLIPELAGTFGDLVVCSVRDYAQPAAAIRRALYDGTRPTPPISTDTPLSSLLTRFDPPDKHLVIFFDQFERLFAQPIERQKAFADNIADALSQDTRQRLHLVFVLPPQYVPAVRKLQTSVVDGVFLNNMQAVPALTKSEAQDAVENPLRRGQGMLDYAKVEPGLIDRLLAGLAQLSDNDDKTNGGLIYPAPLQIVCAKLYAEARRVIRREGDQAEMTIRLFEGLHRVDGILTGYLNEQLSTIAADTGPIWRVLSALAQSDPLRFYRPEELARQAKQDLPQVEAWLQSLCAGEIRLVEPQGDGAYALAANYLLKEIRRQYKDQLKQDSVQTALASAMTDWDYETDIQSRLTAPSRLRRIRDGFAQLGPKPRPREYALLLRSAVAAEMDPGFWITQIAHNDIALAAFQSLENMNEFDDQVAEVLGLFEGDQFWTLSHAAVLSSQRNVRRTASLALTLLGPDKTLALLEPYWKSRPFGQQFAAIKVLARMRSIGVVHALPGLDPLITLMVLWLRIYARRMQYAALALSTFASIVLMGFLAAALPVIAETLANPLPNQTQEYILAFAVETTLGLIVSVPYALAMVLAFDASSWTARLLRAGSIVASFALANLVVVTAASSVFTPGPPLLLGALIGAGLALANEWSLAQPGHGVIRRIAPSAVGPALSAMLAALLTIGAANALGISLGRNEALPWRWAGGVNPGVLASYGPVGQALAYVAWNMLIAAVIGLGFALGSAIGDWLGQKLDQARFI